MENAIFADIRDSLSSSSYFSHTDYNRAEEFFENIPAGIQDKVNVCIVGVDNYLDIPVISGSITKCLNHFGGKDNIRIVTGPDAGFENIVRTYARRNNIELDVYDELYGVDFGWLTRKKFRIEDMLRNSHVLIVIGSGKAQQYAYDEARASGKLVKRFLAKLK